MPADQETIRYTGFHGADADGQPYLMREVLGGGSGGRPWADGSDTIHVVPDSKNLPVEFTETRFPLLVESLALAPDSGGAGKRRGGLGYRKEIRVLRDCAFPVGRRPLDPRLLGPEGRQGGRAVPRHGRSRRPERARAGRAGRRRADPGRHAGARSTRRAAAAGATRSSASPSWWRSTCSRARSAPAPRATTTAWCWPDPRRIPRWPAPPRRALRDQLRAARGRQPFFDRGPGYRTLAGVDHAEVDFVDTTDA